MFLFGSFFEGYWGGRMAMRVFDKKTYALDSQCEYIDAVAPPPPPPPPPPPSSLSSFVSLLYKLFQLHYKEAHR